MRDKYSRRRVMAGGLALTGLVLLGACVTPPPPQPAIPEIRFNTKPTIVLSAGAVTIRDDAPVPAGGPDWGNVFPTLPARAMWNWGEDRLASDSGSPGAATYRIVEASIEHRMEDPVKGVFKPKRREKFTVRVGGVVDIARDDGTLAGTARAKAWGSESIEVDAEPYMRKKAVDGLVRRVMGEFDREMEQTIRANMAGLRH